MKINFDTKAKIAGIGLSPWTRLGPERWFEDYRIVSLYGWDVDDIAGTPRLYALNGNNSTPSMSRLNSQNMIESAAFSKVVTDKLQGYSFQTYKPVSVPESLKQADIRFLKVDQSLAQQIENKAEFRQLFADSVRMPSYEIYDRNQLTTDSATLKKILKGREQVILQDEILSGGKGTFRVATVDDLRYALDSIKTMYGGERVIVSELIKDAHERSVQCCVTRYGVFVGPLQKQIVGDPLLANLKVADGDKFCGAEITADDPYIEAYKEIKSYAESIGKILSEKGYRGIFGMDCLVNDRGDVFVLEVNARITGVTPLLTMLYRTGKDIPFYLLHILELAGMDYDIVDESYDQSASEGSMLIMHAQNDRKLLLDESPSSGLYSADSKDFIKKDFQLPQDHDGILLQKYTPQGVDINPGGRLTVIYSNGRVLDDNDRLRPEIRNTVDSIDRKIKLSEVRK